MSLARRTRTGRGLAALRWIVAALLLALVAPSTALGSADRVGMSLVVAALEVEAAEAGAPLSHAAESEPIAAEGEARPRALDREAVLGHRAAEVFASRRGLLYLIDCALLR
jgi:hypothetical protein